MSQANWSQTKEVNKMKKSYNDISYERRIKLIEYIDKHRRTIRSAAAQLGIKICTAKYILYLYRKKGKISQRKKAQFQIPQISQGKSSNKTSQESNIQYIYVPIPVYIYCYSPQATNFSHLEQINRLGH